MAKKTDELDDLNTSAEETADKSAKSEKADKSEKKPKAEKTEPAKVKRGGVVKYFHDLRQEMKKVVWPTKKELANNTVVVISCIVILGAFVAALDTGLVNLLDIILNRN